MLIFHAATECLYVCDDDIECTSRLDQRKIEAAATFIANQLNSPLFQYNSTTSASTSTGSASNSVSGSGQTSTISKLNPQRGVKWVWLGNYIENLAR